MLKITKSQSFASLRRYWGLQWARAFSTTSSLTLELPGRFDMYSRIYKIIMEKAITDTAFFRLAE